MIRMTEKRENWLYPDASGLYFPHDGFIMRATDGKQYGYEEECDLLNKLTEENKELKKGKTRYELLYRHSKEEISNRILSIKEHIENCSDNQVKQSLQELFYSEVIEYDISKENRRLRTENDQLRQKIKELEVENESQSDAIDGLQEFIAHNGMED